MSISEQELDGKRRRAELLRSEIRSLRTEGTASRAANEREAASAALDDEIARLERELLQTNKDAGGSVEDAMRAMEQAAELQKMHTPEPDDDPKDESVAVPPEDPPSSHRETEFRTESREATADEATADVSVENEPTGTESIETEKTVTTKNARKTGGNG